MKKAKPFEISKKVVWEAWKHVKANRGAAGVDSESIADFEVNLKDNLYKIWNRMSSGSYFPPPVRTVSIPKKTGGERYLGIPLFPIELHRWWSRLTLSLLWSPIFTRTHMVTGLKNQLFRQLGLLASDAGGITGCLNLISRVCSTILITICC